MFALSPVLIWNPFILAISFSRRDLYRQIQFITYYAIYGIDRPSIASAIVTETNVAQFSDYSNGNFFSLRGREGMKNGNYTSLSGLITADEILCEGGHGDQQLSYLRVPKWSAAKACDDAMQYLWPTTFSSLFLSA